MGIRNFPVISIGSETASQQLLVAAPGNIAIPTMKNGSLPKFLHCSAHTGASSNVITVSPETAATDGDNTTGFPLAVLGNNSVILNVHGFSFIGFDEIGDGTSTLQLYPLEDF